MIPTEIQSWLNQFSIEDQYTALSLIKNISSVSIQDLEEALEKELLCISCMYKNKKVAIFPVLEDAEENQCAGKGIRRKKAGSSHQVIYFLERIARKYPQLFSARPTETSMISEKHAAIIYVDDIVGSGSRVVSFWKKFVTKKVKSWLSYGYCDLFFVSGIIYKKGVDNIIRSIGKFKEEQLISCFAAPTFEKRNSDKFKTICRRYSRKLNQSDIPLGYGDIFSSAVFSYKCPNNTPPILWGNGGKWKALFNNTSVKSDVFSYISSSKKERIFEKVWDAGQLKMACSMIDNAGCITDDDLNFLCFLSLTSRRMLPDNILTVLSCSRSELSNIIKKAKKFKAIDSDGRISNFGKQLLAAFRKKIRATQVHAGIDPKIAYGYIPTQYGGAVK